MKVASTFHGVPSVEGTPPKLNETELVAEPSTATSRLFTPGQAVKSGGVTIVTVVDWAVAGCDSASRQTAEQATKAASRLAILLRQARQCQSR